MKKKTSDFSYALTGFLTTYLSGMRNLSQNTIHSYRDTFKLLLIYAKNEKKIEPYKFTLDKFKRELISDYLEWLKKERKLCQRSVNQRLAAIHSFCKYLHTEKSEYILEYQKILAIPFMKYHKPVIEYLTKEALESIFDAVDTSTWQGKRDLVLLCTLYDTGARVQELCGINVNDVHFADAPYVILTGKGNKSRYVPIMKKTANLLKSYKDEYHKTTIMSGSEPLFYTRQHTRFSRSAVSHLISKYAEFARDKTDMIPEKVTPHTFRHTKAMHLCQAGIDMIYIRDILGHVRLSTTEVYAKINVEQMRDALEKAYPELNPQIADDWNNDSSLMDFLNSL